MSQMLQTAIKHHQAGQLAEAEKLYRGVLASEPRNADALSLLGVVLESLDRPEEAVTSIEQAIALDPKAALFRLHHGNALMKAKRFAQAETAFQKATELMPNFAHAYYNLANALREQQKFKEAMVACRKAITCDPNLYMAHNDLGLLHAGQKEFKEALEVFDRLCKKAPDFFMGHLSRCQVLDQANDHERLLAESEQLMKKWPTEDMALFMRGLALNRVGRDPEAVTVYEGLLARNPRLPEAWDNYAQSLAGSGRFEESFKAYQEALKLDVNVPIVNFHVALAYLIRGDFKEGFARYHWRFPSINIPRPGNKAPHWEGQDIAGKTLLVYEEQGFGDSIMAMRYLPLLAKRGIKVVFACRDALIDCVQHWKDSGLSSLVSWTLAKDTACDYQVPIMDLLHIFGATTETIPSQVPYLPAPPLTAATTLAPTQKMKIGLMWKGNKNFAHDKKRSVSLEMFTPLLELPNTQYYSLVRAGDLEDDEKQLIARHGIVDLGSKINSFADTAAFMAQFDFLVSVDTSTIHLAGAMAVPSFVMLRLNTDWRWLLNRDDNVWYPTVRLFRQSVKKDWNDVIAQMQSHVAALAEKHLKK